MNRILKRALWGTLIAGGITLAGATAANAAEAPPNGADCGGNVVTSTLTTVTNLLTGPCDQSQPGDQPGEGGTGGTSALPAVTQDVTDLVTDVVSVVAPAAPAPGGSDSGGDSEGTPGGSTPGGTESGGSVPGGSDSGGVPTTGVVTVPVPGVGTVHAGLTPDGIDVGKNLNVAGVKDVWDLTAGPQGIATTDRIGTDATNVLVDAAVPTSGATAPHATVTLPQLGDLTGGLPTVPGLPLGDLTGALGSITGSVPSVPSLPALPSVPGAPGTGGSTPGMITIPVPGVGSVHAGTAPDGIDVGKNLNVAGVKDVWDLTAGPQGIATTDRIGTDATNVLVDAAVPTSGATAPHATVTLPKLGGITGGLPSVPGLPGTGGIPGLPGLPLGDLTGALGSITGSVPSLPSLPALPLGDLTGALGSITGSVPSLPSLPGLPSVPGLPGTGGSTPGMITVPVPGIGSVHAGTTPDGIDIGTNLNVAGVKDVSDLTVGPHGIATTDRIGTDATNVLVDAAVPTNGATAPYVSVTLPRLATLTSVLPGLPGSVLPGLPGGTTPGTGGSGGSGNGGSGNGGSGNGGSGNGGSGNGTAGTGIGGASAPITQVVSRVTHGLNTMGITRSTMSANGNGSLAQTGGDLLLLLLFAGTLLLAAGAAVKLVEQRR